MRIRGCSRVVVLAALFAAKSLALAAAQYVPIRDLDPGALYSQKAVARVRSGVVAGSGNPGGGMVGLIIDAAGIHQLISYPGTTSFARDVRDDGNAIGYAFTASRTASTMAVLWQGGTPSDLNTLVTGGSKNYLAACYGFDRHGRICGGSIAGRSLVRAFLFDQGFVTDLGALTGGNGLSVALAMNDHVECVGYSNSANNYHAVLFYSSGIHDLHDPLQITGPFSEADDIDHFGRICGRALFNVSGGTTRMSAVVWDHGIVTDLGAGLSGTSESYGTNDFGDVVGWTNDPMLGARAVLFRAGSAIPIDTLIDPTLGWTLQRATGIDDEGRITGTGQLNGIDTAWILEPACPGSFSNYGSGCAGTGGLVPLLRGRGCPTPDRDFALEFDDGLPNAVGFLFLGGGTGTLNVKPGCDLQVLPLLLPPLPLTLDGFGEAWSAVHLPAGTPPFDVYVQALFFDPGAAHAISATNPLQMHFQ